MVCRQLDLGYALAAVKEAAFGSGSGGIWRDSIRCFGNENSLLACPMTNIQSGCIHSEDAGAVSSGTG